MSINALLAQGGGDIIQKYTYGLLAALLVIGVGLSYFFLPSRIKYIYLEHSG